jgi:ELWxxDGT repeat protein
MSSSSRVLCALMALALSPIPPLAAQQIDVPFLVQDYSPGGEVAERSAPEGPFTVLGEEAFFLKDCALWRTDGTPGGTALVRLLFANPSCGVSMPVVLGNHLIFVMTQGPGFQVWRSDGTALGTQPIAVLPYPPNLLSGGPLVMGGVAYFGFQVNNIQPGPLWKTDGTTEGTTEVAVWADFRSPVVVGNRVFFKGRSFEAGNELWVTDGSTGGTRLVKDIWPGLSSGNPESITRVGDRVFFVADDGSGRQLWVSDGTAAGTKVTRNLDHPEVGWGGPSHLTSMGSWLLFVVDDGIHGGELWRSDGTPQGTAIVVDLWTGPGGTSSISDQLTDGAFPVLPSGVALFNAYGEGSSGPYAWRTDGTVEGTWKLRDCAGSCPFYSWGFVVWGKHAYFTVLKDQETTELWRTDGSREGTVGPSKACGGRCPFNSPGRLSVVGERLLVAVTGAYWTTDQESGRWQRSEVPQVVVPYGTDWVALSDVNGRLDFSTASTEPIEGWIGGGEGAVRYRPPSGLPSGGMLFGCARPINERVSSLLVRASESEAWHLLRSFDFNYRWNRCQARMAAFRGGVLLAGSEPATGIELWFSDGSEDGTYPVKDLVPGPDGSCPDKFFALGDRAVFEAADQEGKPGLWVTDGTTGGTQLIRAGFGQAGGVLVGDKAFLYSWATGGLYVTDGTTAGTHQVTSGLYAIGTRGLASYKGLLFLSGDSSTRGTELYSTDGTTLPSGKVPIADINPGPGSSSPRWLAVMQDTLYFAADDGVHGAELWATDGTAAGTRLIKDIEPGPVGSEPQDLTAAGGVLYFSAFDAEHGNELWRSDGTSEGTVLVDDLTPGPVGTWPSLVYSHPIANFTAIGSHLTFMASTPEFGRELWALRFHDGPVVDATDVTVRRLPIGPWVATLPITISRPPESEATVRFRTRRGSAVPGEDYVEATGIVTIPAGSRHLAVPVTILPGAGAPRARTLSIEIEVSGELVVQRRTGIVTIEPGPVPSGRTRRRLTKGH